MREDGDDRFVFMCNTDRNQGFDSRIIVRGQWEVEGLETFTGDSFSIDADLDKWDGWTAFNYRFEGCGSLLFRLSPKKHESKQLAMHSMLPLRGPVKAPGDQSFHILTVTLVLRDPKTTLRHPASPLHHTQTTNDHPP